MNAMEILLIAALIFFNNGGETAKEVLKSNQPPYNYPSTPINYPFQYNPPPFIEIYPFNNFFPYLNYRRAGFIPLGSSGKYTNIQRQLAPTASSRTQWVPIPPYYLPDSQDLPPQQTDSKSNPQNNGFPQGSVVQTPHQYVYYQRPASSQEEAIQQMPVQQVMVFSGA